MKSYLLFIVWLTICSILLTLPGNAFPKKNWLDDIYIDKWVHTGMFAVMASLLCWGYYKNTGRRRYIRQYFIFFAVICLAYGIGMEYVQKYFVANRSFDNGDIIADGIGAIAGTVFSWFRYIKK